MDREPCLSLAMTLHVVVVGALTVGCVHTSPSVERAQVDAMVVERTGIDAGLEPEAAERQLTERIDALLAEPLTVSSASVMALLNNPDLGAQVQELGVARAELVAAGLLDNPVLAGELMVTRTGVVAESGIGLTQSLLGAFLIPARRRLAKAHLEHAVLEVAFTTLALLRDTELGLVDVAYTQRMVELETAIVAAAELADDLAQRQHAAGNVRVVDREQRAAELDAARLGILEVELEHTRARENITRLLGLWGHRVDWRVADWDWGMPAAEVDLATLESLAIEARLDIGAARAHKDAMTRAIELRRRGVVANVDASVDAHREPGDGEFEWRIGPGLAVEIPLFDWGRADLAQLEAQRRRTEYELQALAVRVRSDVRLEREQFVAAQRRVSYVRDVVLPRQQRIFDEHQALYNAMQIGAYELFAARVEQLRAEQAYVAANRDYWQARTRLAFAVGTHLPERAHSH